MTHVDSSQANNPADEPSGDGAPGDRGRPTRSRRRGRRKKAPWWELPVLVIIAVTVAVLVKTFLIQPFYIPSASMEKTLHGCPGCSGDRVIVNKPIYTLFRDPHPGDIVVFRAPPGWSEGLPSAPTPSNPVVRAARWFGQLVGVVPPNQQDLIKRVIAIGGQTVKCCDAAGNVQVSDNGPNGPFQSLNDASYVYEDPGAQAAGQLKFGPVTVPNGRLWVMGDHRNDSRDSRYYCGTPPGPQTTVCANANLQTATNATVPVSAVIGKAVLIAWPPSRWTTLGTPPTFTKLPLPSAAGRLSGG